MAGRFFITEPWEAEGLGEGPNRGKGFRGTNCQLWSKTQRCNTKHRECSQYFTVTDAQRDGVVRWGLWEGQESGALINEINAVIRRSNRAPQLLLPCEDTPWEFCAPGEGPQPTMLHPDLRLPASRTVRNKCLLISDPVWITAARRGEYCTDYLNALPTPLKDWRLPFPWNCPISHALLR